jgi:hypothetical protein
MLEYPASLLCVSSSQHYHRFSRIISSNTDINGASTAAEAKDWRGCPVWYSLHQFYSSSL